MYSTRYNGRPKEGDVYTQTDSAGGKYVSEKYVSEGMLMFLHVHPWPSQWQARKHLSLKSIKDSNVERLFRRIVL